MSTQPNLPPPKPPGDYQGPERFSEWVYDYLAIDLSDAQRAINRSVAEHQRTLVIGANGFGKTYDVAGLSLAWLFTNYPSVVFATSGTYGKLKRTLCRPLEDLHRTAGRTRYIPGEYTDRPPRISVDGHPEWFFEAARPRDAGELEGTHSEHLLAVIEEVDKDAVDERVIDSMESLLTDERDRIIAIGNPPEDETNVAYQLMEDPAWNVLQFSSFESHNVEHDLGIGDDGYIDGLVTLDQIRHDWEAWNHEDWPGIDAARVAHEDRTDLDARWYRRRAGVVPPATAQVLRPYTLADVEDALETGGEKARLIETQNMGRGKTPLAVGLDVARQGGDWNALAAYYKWQDAAHIEVHDRWQGVDHVQNESTVAGSLNQWRDPPTAVDAQGEGSGLADRLGARFNIRRYHSGSAAVNGTQYYDKWTEANCLLGQFFRDGGTIGGAGPLGEELSAAARALTLEEKWYDKRGSTVYKADPKDDIKDVLGWSPDVLDAVLMAVWLADLEDPDGDSRLTW